MPRSAWSSLKWGEQERAETYECVWARDSAYRGITMRIQPSRMDESQPGGWGIVPGNLRSHVSFRRFPTVQPPVPARWTMILADKF